MSEVNSLAFDTEPDQSKRSGYHPLTLFAIVWALATIIHLLSFPFWARTWQGWLVVLTFGLVLLKPTSLPRFTWFITASLCNLFRAMPFVPNHVLFEGMVNLTILISIGWSTWRTAAKEMLLDGLKQFLSRCKWDLLFVVGIVGLMSQFENEYLCGTCTGILLLHLHLRKIGEAKAIPLANRVYKTFAPVLRWEMVVMYFWAAIQKMNWDYFNPEVSAAVQLHTEIAQLIPLIPDQAYVYPLAIWGSLLCEIGIPLLLLFTATRRAGIVMAILFHLFLSIHPHAGIYSYSALIYGLLFVFLSPEAIRSLQSQWRDQMTRLQDVTSNAVKPHHVAMLINGCFFLMVVIFGINYESMGYVKETFMLNSRIGFGAWALLAFWLGSSYLHAAWRLNVRQWKLPLQLSMTPALLGLLLVVSNGLNPWLGLKTQTSFSMFSNLRTEFETNHMFLKRIDLFDYQQDMVEIIHAEPDILTPKGDPQGIEQFANPGRILPFVELRRLLSRTEGDVSLLIVRSGEPQLIVREDRKTTHPDAFTPLSLAEQKLLWFRRHESWSGPMPCTH